MLTVDDDPQVVEAIKRDLRSRYGKRFRILKAGSGQKTLELVKQLKLRNETVALLIVDQRMPQMSGVELLEQSISSTALAGTLRSVLRAFTGTIDLPYGVIVLSSLYANTADGVNVAAVNIRIIADTKILVMLQLIRCLDAIQLRSRIYHTRTSYKMI